MRYKLHVKHHCDAAHFLPDHKGKCANLHGHRWVVDIQLETFDDPELTNGMIVDFAEIKAVIDRLDHTLLNDIIALRMPTAENVAAYIARNIAAFTAHICAKLSVTVWENPDCGITVEFP